MPKGSSTSSASSPTRRQLWRQRKARTATCYPSRHMYPTLLRVGNFEITTFGLMMFIAFIIGGWVLTRQYRRYGLSEDLASSMIMAAAIGGIAGAKIYYAILFHDWHLLFDRAGLVWYGGLIGGFLGCSGYILAKKLDFFSVADAAAPALAIVYALGRIGCFLDGA